MENDRLLSLSETIKVFMSSLDREELCSAYEDLISYKATGVLKDGVFKAISKRISEVSGVTDFGLDYTSQIILFEIANRYYNNE